MPNHSTSPLIRRTSTLAAAAVVLVAVVAAGIGTVATAGPAGAAGGTTTYSATTIRPGPLPAAYGSSANSDGWAVALSSTQVFNVTHHLAQLDVTCHNQSNGSPCWTPDQTKVITNGSNNYVTPLGAGLYLDQSTGHLFTYAVQVGPTGPTFGTAGVVCIDTSNPVTASFCGFTALSAAGESPIPTGQYAGISAPVQVGNNWYAFNTVSGVGAGGGTHGTENTLMCFSLTSFQACPTTNYTIPFSGPAQCGDAFLRVGLAGLPVQHRRFAVPPAERGRSRDRGVCPDQRCALRQLPGRHGADAGEPGLGGRSHR